MQTSTGSSTECLLRPAHFRPPSAYCDQRTFALTRSGSGAGVDLPSFGPDHSYLYLPTHPGTPSSSSNCLFGATTSPLSTRKDFGVGWILATTSFRHCLGDFQALALDPGEFVCTQPTATGPAQRRTSRLLLALNFRDVSTNVQPQVPPWSRPWQ